MNLIQAVIDQELMVETWFGMLIGGGYLRAQYLGQVSGLTQICSVVKIKSNSAKPSLTKD